MNANNLNCAGTIFIPTDARRESGILLTDATGGMKKESQDGWFIQRQFARLGIQQALWDYSDAKPSVIVTMGEHALNELTGLKGLQKHHAYVFDSPWGLVIPTYHPTLQPFAITKGNHKLTALWCFVVQRALDIVKSGFVERKYELLLDPLPATASHYLDVSRPILIADIETDFIVTDEDEVDLRGGGQIVRISFSNQQGTAISIPWTPPYISIAQAALKAAREVIFWNQAFDVPRLRAAGCAIPGRITDAMWMWHWLQSDLPKSLGFVAPLLMPMRPWKHESASRPAYYSAMDSAITMDCYLAIKERLHQQSRLAQFESECTEIIPFLESMGARGLLINRVAQAAFKLKLEGERDALDLRIQLDIPDAVKPSKQYKRMPKKLGPLDAFLPDENGVGGVKVMPFNPGSPVQKKKLLKHLGLPLAHNKKTDRDTAEAKHLRKYAKKFPVLKLINDWGERNKIITSYIWRLHDDDRVHPSFGFHPSTWRKSCRNPNVQTIPKRNDLAAEFRRMFIARDGYLLVECDSSGIEAVLVGYFANSPDYIALAKRGVHKWLAEQRAGRPVSKTEALYDQIKRVVHLSNYMGSAARILEEYPDDFKTRREAQELQDFYFNTPAGKDVRKWQVATLAQAHAEHSLDTPFGQRHYFYNVYTYRNGSLALGEDSKRAVAFRPQATASAIQSLFLRNLPAWMLPFMEAVIHDSFIAEVPVADAERFAVELLAVMTAPIPELGGLSIGAECKIGPNLAEMEVVNAQSQIKVAT